MLLLSCKQVARLRSLIVRQFSGPLAQREIYDENPLTQLNLPQLVTTLQTMPVSDAHRLFNDGVRRMRILEHAKHQMRDDDDESQHKALAEIYSGQFSQTGKGRGASFLLNDLSFMLEERLLDEVDRLIKTRLTKMDAQIPTESSKAFIRWLIKLVENHPAALHPFYTHFMRKQATRADLRFWLAQESTLDQRFDDVLANLQVGTNGVVKMEIAKNYWDEMGNGDDTKTHTRLFAQLLDELEVTPAYIASNLMSASLCTGNLSSCFAFHRHLFYEALGFFGVVEYLAPSRFTHVLAALKRNGVSEEGQAYHKLHIWIDRIHGAAWFNDVVRLVVEQKPDSAKAIVRGALARLETSLLHLNAFPSSLNSEKIHKNDQQISTINSISASIP